MTNFFQKYFNKRPRKKIKLIHADDHALVRSGVRHFLGQKADIEYVGEAANGLELLQLLETTVPDIILLDLQMPVMDGMEVLPKIKEGYPGVKLIILCLHNDPDLVVRMMQRGASSFLSLAADSEEIYQAIKSVHEYGSYYSKAIEKALLDSYIPRDKPEPSPKERQILHLQKENKSVKEIAEQLDISERTVLAIMDKMKKTK